MTILTVSCVFTLVTLLSAESSPCEEKNERREAPAPMCQSIFLESNGRKWAGNSHPNAADPARFARLRQLRVRGCLQTRCPSKCGRNCSNPLWSTGFFTRICPKNSGQCSIEHLSIVLSHQRRLPQERSCLTDSVPRSGQLLSQSLTR